MTPDAPLFDVRRLPDPVLALLWEATRLGSFRTSDFQNPADLIDWPFDVGEVAQQVQALTMPEVIRRRARALRAGSGRRAGVQGQPQGHGLHAARERVHELSRSDAMARHREAPR